MFENPQKHLDWRTRFVHILLPSSLIICAIAVMGLFSAWLRMIVVTYHPSFGEVAPLVVFVFFLAIGAGICIAGCTIIIRDAWDGYIEHPRPG